MTLLFISHNQTLRTVFSMILLSVASFYHVHHVTTPLSSLTSSLSVNHYLQSSTQRFSLSSFW